VKDNNKIKTKNCSNCGAVFSCNDNGNSCWCNNHNLTAEQLNYLRNNYDNCLCETCIKNIVALKS